MTNDKKFERICGDLSVEAAGICRTFKALCREYDAEEMIMDNMFYENFGMSGDEVLSKFHKDSIVIAV